MSFGGPTVSLIPSLTKTKWVLLWTHLPYTHSPSPYIYIERVIVHMLMMQEPTFDWATM